MDSVTCTTRRLSFILLVLTFLLGGFLACAPSAHAEGTSDLVANGGYRPYTERYNSATLGQQRLSVMHVYMNEGETAYFGTSVADAKLYEVSDNKNSGWLFSNSAMGTNYSDTQLAYVNTADVYIAQGNYANIADAIGAGMTPGKTGVTLIDLDNAATSSTPGYIYNSTQEAGGVDLTSSGAGYKVTSDNTISTSTSGYVAGTKTNANTFTAPSTGIYTVVFFSQKHNGDNPTKTKVSDTTAFKTLQKGGTVASWDISVYDGDTLQTGRVFTSTLFINMGGNVLSGGVSQGSLYSDVYAVTNDGYRYKVDFNGMDPFGFVFFANNRGLLDTSNGAATSLYHGIRSDNNTLSDVASHGIALNNTPYDTSLDRTYNLFYETPSAAALSALGINDPSTSGSISDFIFTGNEGSSTGTNEGYVGEGGTFSFTVGSVSATSYEIDLNFGTGNTVVLSNTLVSGKNSIYWNGRDANGDIVPAGTYTTSNITVKLKGGEVHFPLLDVEQNPSGIIITRLNGSDAPDSTVYFNNSSSNTGDTTSPWTLAKNWEVGNETNATGGVDSSSGAMAFTNTHTANSAKGMKLLGDGDQSALDIWAYYTTPASIGDSSFKLVDTSFTVTKVWDNDAGTPAAGNPEVTMTLHDNTGAIVATNVLGAGILNPVTYDTTASTSYTWTNLDPAKTYYVTEAALTGYTTANSGSAATVTGSVADGYAQIITNTYVPTKLTIAKVWNHGSTEEEPQADWPTSVVIHVYTDAAKTHEITGSPFTLTSASTDESGNTWAQTITGLDPTLSYYCYEDAVTGYNGSTGGLASGSATSGYKSTFTNTFESKTYAYAQVLKQWSGDIIDGVSYRPSSVTMTLINKDTKEPITKDAAGKAISPVTLTADNSWYYAWPMLPKTDAAGKTINYNIVETTPDGYTATTEPADPPLVIGNLTSVIWDNAYKTTSFTVNKTWENGVNTTQPSSVTVQLQQSLDGGDTYNDYGTLQTLNADDNWTYKWSDLPSYTSGSKLIEYKAVETAVDGYTTNQGNPSYVTEGDEPVGTWLQTITNTYDYTQLTISKTWDHGSQATADQPTAASFALYNGGVIIGSCVLNADNDWTYTFVSVPKNANLSVKEEPIPGYTATSSTLSGSDDKGYTISFENKHDETTVTATKVWDHGTQAEADWPTSVTLQLYADGVAYGNPVAVTADSKDAAGDAWGHTWTGLDCDKTYSVTEDKVDNYATTGGTLSGSDATGYTTTFTNKYTLTSLTVGKTWDHGSQPKADWPGYVTVHVFANSEEVGSCILNEDNSWTHTFSGLASGKSMTVTEDKVDDYTATVGALAGSDADGWTCGVENDYKAPAGTTSTTGTGSTSPLTGDTGNLVLFAAGLLALLGGILIGLGGRRMAYQGAHGGGQGARGGSRGPHKGAHSK